MLREEDDEVIDFFAGGGMVYGSVTVGKGEVSRE